MMLVDVRKSNMLLFIKKKKKKKSLKSLCIDLNSIPLMCSTTIHYSLPLTKWELEVENTNIFLHNKHITDQTKTEKKKKA